MSKLFLVIVLSTVLVVATRCNRAESLPFDARLWREHQYDESATNPRLFMAQDLLRSKVLIGMHRDDVLALLGPPIDAAADKRTAKELLFSLGARRTGEAVLLGVVFEQERAVETIIRTW